MTLDEAQRGLPVQVVGTSGARPAVARRLAELGIRAGARLHVQTRTSGGGAVLAIGDDRIAVGRAILVGVQVERVEASHG